MKTTQRLYFFVMANAIGSFLLCGCSDKKEQAQNKATESYLAGDWSETISYARKWAEADTTDPAPHALMNVAYTMLDDRDSIRLELKSAYGSDDNILKVQRFANQLVVEHKDNPRAYLLKGAAFQASGDYELALRAYNGGISADPTFRMCYQAIGNLYYAMHDYSDALVSFSFLVAKFPNYPDGYGSIGAVYIAKNDVARALPYFEKHVELAPNNVTALHNLATVYHALGNKSKASIIFNRIIELDPVGQAGRDAKQKLLQLK